MPDKTVCRREFYVKTAKPGILKDNRFPSQSGSKGHKNPKPTVGNKHKNF